MEVLFVAVVMLCLLEYNKKVSTKKFFEDYTPYLSVLKEADYDFLVSVRYGDEVDPNKLYEGRIQLAIITLFIMLFVFLSSLSLVNILIAVAVSYLIFKNSYNSLKAFHKKHLHTVDTMLPYYLKSLEILAQHYTVPVALARSIDSAPEIFKSGLRKITEKINAGDATIEPYVQFAIDYPVRDSMRMMRLLYRLGIGTQDNKIEQLLVFSKTVSALQNKAREVKYKERLNSFEDRTMIMLGVTGGGVMLLLLISLTMFF